MAELWQHLLDGMGTVLAFFYAVVPSYGVAIIGLTVAVRLLLFPLTAKQARSMQKMQLIQPEIKRLQARYKDDRQKLNEEIMKFYKENQVNPLAGCLPLVAQMPIFFALFAVLRHPVQHIPRDSNLFQAFCGAADPAACKPKGLGFLGMNLSEAASADHSGFIHALPYFILIALVVVTGYLQFKQTQSRQGAAQANPQAQIMGKLFPLMFAFISFNLPSGVVLYFLVSNAWQIGQQALIFGSLVPGGAQGDIGSASPGAKGGDASGKSGGAALPKGTGPGKGGAPAKGGGPAKAGGAPRAGGPSKSGGSPRAGGPVPGGGGKSGNGREAKAPPEDKASGANRDGTSSTPDGFGRAQPSGSRPRPKKRRR